MKNKQNKTNWMNARKCPVCGDKLATNGVEVWCVNCTFEQKIKPRKWGLRTARDIQKRSQHEKN